MMSGMRRIVVRGAARELLPFSIGTAASRLLKPAPSLRPTG
jgi:hypothetical protein